MINFKDVSIRRGGQLLFSGVNFTVHAGQKVGITGANGTGKSSLLSLIREELHTDHGECTLPPKLVIGHVAQETPALSQPAIDHVIDGDAELRAHEAELAKAEADGDGTRLAELYAHLEAIDGYTARARAARLIHGLGFATDEDERPVSSFSGGWRMRLNLARALMCRSDLLLLDEPSNHLDLDAVIWLEDWLRGYGGTLLLISHDRDFLDRVVNQIAHIERGAVKLYPGNYSEFERRRAEQLASQQSAYERQQREIKHIKRFVDRFRAKATKARQAQSRLKTLERMERIAPAHVDSPFHLSFPAPDRLPNPLLRLDEAQAGYADTPVLSRVRLNLSPGDRIGLLGHNGAGKSTLIKLLAGELRPLAGKREEAQDLRIGYFAQHQLEQLDPAATPLVHLLRLDAAAREQNLRDYLGGYGFRGDAVTAPVAPFSGGEKARLVLALLIYRRPNLLLLDEPTNHLDLEMRLAVSMALQEYEGAMVLVSHDRHLLRITTDELWLVSAGRVQPFDGDLDGYAQWLANNRGMAPDVTAPAAVEPALGRKERRRQEAEARRRLQPLRDEVRRLEALMAQLESEKSVLERRLSAPDLYEPGQKDKLKSLLAEQARVNRSLIEAESAWLAAGEELEGAERAT